MQRRNALATATVVALVLGAGSVAVAANTDVLAAQSNAGPGHLAPVVATPKVVVHIVRRHTTATSAGGAPQTIYVVDPPKATLTPAAARTHEAERDHESEGRDD